MQTTSQLVPTGADGVRVGTRRRDDCRSYVLPHVRELPLRLECVAHDSFGGLVCGNAVSRVTTTAINHPR